MTGECGTSGERVREVMGETASAMTHFAVPFTSGAAGIMLAAELVKEQLAAPVPLSTRQPRATIQFWRPAQSAGAKPYRRDPSCPQCRGGTPAHDIWYERVSHRPDRQSGEQVSQTGVA
jgi:hypothetical protein